MKMTPPIPPPAMPELVQYSGHADDNAGLKNSIVRDSKIKRRSTLARGAAEEPSVCIKKELI